MQNSEVEYKKTKSEPLAARPASTAVLWGCVGGRLTVCQSICRLSGVLPWHGPWGGEERWQKRTLWATLWEMQHLHASEHKRSGGKRRVARNEQVCRSCPVFANAPHRERACLHPRAYTGPPKRGSPRSPRHSVTTATLKNRQRFNEQPVLHPKNTQVHTFQSAEFQS